ncbi:NADH-quinone oxidoreductase subunit G [Candidatus Providencia siddallii]|uniref:NADH-quinone oxidoreductase subunit G n=2 Tax=Candidatus Providencia siddallii TaxID=1715285 RepID=A0ABM9NNN3_9GAMM
MVLIYIDNKEYRVSENDNLLQACLSLGLDIPYFCWHPVLGSFGSCRQCAVKQYKNIDDISGNIVMSCMTPVIEGIRISISDEETKNFRKCIIECLMTNHPHDCPICEEAGNCHLQDMTVMTGHYIRKYRFSKRTHINQDLGPFIKHEMNRCISCYRCINYYKNYADGVDLGVFGSHNNIYFGRAKEGSLESEFSGNLVEICPTGVFTDKTYSEFYNRKWDMQFAPSICHHCSIGCNIILGERYGKIGRVENRYNGSINHYFLCDRGRFGYGYTNREDRPNQILLRQNGIEYIISSTKAIQNCIEIINNAKRVIGIGSSRASIESNYVLRKLVGSENFFSDFSDGEHSRLQLILNILKNGGIYTPTLREIEKYDMILVLGEDLTQTSPRMALSIRQAIKNKTIKQNIFNWQTEAIKNIYQNNKNILIITNTDETSLKDIATFNYYAPADDQARFAFAIANIINNELPNVSDLSEDLKRNVKNIAQLFVKSRNPLIISGTHSASESLIKSAANIAFSLRLKGINVGLSYLVSNANSIGLAMMNAKSIDNAFFSIESNEVDVAIVIENDLYYNNSINVVDNAIQKLNKLIVLDHQKTIFMDKATLAFPSASFVESNGTLINQEGRAQRFFKVFEPDFYNKKIVIKETWKWLSLFQNKLDKKNLQDITFDNVVTDCVLNMPQFKKIIDVSPKSSFNIHGQKLAREPHRYSGRTAILANKSVHEPSQPKDLDSPFVFSMEGNNNMISKRQQIAFAWSPGWNSPQSWNKFQEKIFGHLLFGDPGVRLFDSIKRNISFFTEIPDRYKPKKSQWLIVPYYHLFGSDEISQRSEKIKNCIPKPYIVLNKKDAIKYNLCNSSKFKFIYNKQTFILNVCLSKYLSNGQIGLPLGMHGLPTSMAGNFVENLYWKI